MGGGGGGGDVYWALAFKGNCAVRNTVGPDRVDTPQPNGRATRDVHHCDIKTTRYIIASIKAAMDDRRIHIVHFPVSAAAAAAPSKRAFPQTEAATPHPYKQPVMGTLYAAFQSN
ncbi:unnamed protein product, partial [Iphiclides podalirius]